MTIVQLNVSDYGSTGAVMQNIRRIALCKGYNAVSFVGRRSHSPDDSEKIGHAADMYAHGFWARIGKNGHGSVHSTKKLTKDLYRLNPDVVILHNLHGYYINLKELFDCLCRLKSTHVFWVLHDCWAFTGSCAYYSSVKCRKWEITQSGETDGLNGSNCFSCPIHNKTYPKSFIDSAAREFKFKRELFTRLDDITLIAPSEWLAAEIRRSFLRKYNTVIINNGVNIDVFKPRSSKECTKVLKKYNISCDKPIILGVASVWDDRKQPELFFKLANIAKDCTVLMVGLSEKQMRTLPENVGGILRTENTEELSCLYSAASVLLNPSLEDNFPLVPLEALACGTPVITSALCGCAEQVDYNTGVILSNPTSVNEAFRAVKTVIDARKDAALLSIKEIDKAKFSTDLCRRRALQYYDYYKMAAKYMELIEKAYVTDRCGRLSDEEALLTV